MDKVKIKNYDVLVVRALQIIIPFLSSYIVIALIVWFVDKRFIEPDEFVEHILLFDAKPIALVISWGITIAIAALLIKGTFGYKIKDSFIMKKWIGLKIWMLTLGKDFE